MAALIPGAARYSHRTPSGRELEGVGKSVKKGERLDLLAAHGQEWFKIIDATVRDIRVALENRDDDGE